MVHITAAKRTEFLRDAASREPGKEVALTVRKLIGYWNAQRRGYWYVREIERDLKAHDLTTSPPFTDGWIDNTVRLVPVRTAAAALAGSLDLPDFDFDLDLDLDSASASQETESALMAGGLTFAELDDILFGGSRPAPISVSPSDSLAKAQSLMMRHDYSQLPVMNGPKSCKGAVSWESIARTLMHKPGAGLVDCIIPVDQLSHNDDVLSNIAKIATNGFVVTKDKTNTIIGVVTTSDLSMAFEELSGPFLRIGIAERKLRQVAEARFDESSIRAAARVSGPGSRAVDSLTLGELKTLFDSDENWRKLEWPIEKSVFRGLLKEVLVLRNRVMHFRHSDEDADGVQALRNLIQWLNYLVD